MARMITFITLAVVMMMLFNFAGISTNSGYILSSLGIIDHPENFKQTSFYTTVLIALGSLLLVGGIRIGFFGVSVSDTAIAATLSVFFATFLGDYISILTYTKGYCSADSNCGFLYFLVSLFIVPIVLGLAISIFDWARGND